MRADSGRGAQSHRRRHCRRRKLPLPLSPPLSHGDGRGSLTSAPWRSMAWGCPPRFRTARNGGSASRICPVVSPGEAASKQPGWLNDLRLYHHRGNASYTGEDFLQGDISGLDDLFTERAEVVQGFIDVYSRWIATFGIAGFRIDTVKHVNTELWQAFAPRMRAVAAEAGRAGLSPVRRGAQWGYLVSQRVVDGGGPGRHPRLRLLLRGAGFRVPGTGGRRPRVALGRR
jgi:hypothetical protein